MKYLDPPLPGPNPCLVDKMPEERQPRYVPPEEDFWKVFEIAEGQDRVMLITLLHLAARRSEIFRLTWSDIDFGNNRVRLWTRKRTDGTYEYDWLPIDVQISLNFQFLRKKLNLDNKARFRYAVYFGCVYPNVAKAGGLQSQGV
jgi:integrase